MIVFSPTDNKHFDGLCSAFTAAFYDWSALWNPQQMPVFDMLQETQAQYLFIDAKYVNQHVAAACAEQHNLKVVVFNTLNPIIKAHLRVFDPSFNMKLVPDEVLSFQLAPAANYARYRMGCYLDKYDTDVFYYHQRNQHTGHIIDDLYEIAEAGYRVRVAGNHLSCPFYIGHTNIYHGMEMATSAKIVLDYDDEMIYNYAVNRIFCLGDTKTFSTLRTGDNPRRSTVERVEKFMASEKDRRVITDKIYDEAIESKTYFHQAATVGGMLESEWKQLITQKFQKLRR